MELLARPDEGLHEGGANLATEQATELEQASDREGFHRHDAAHQEDGERRQREGLTHRLKDL